MGQDVDTQGHGSSSLTKAALDGGLSALSAASSGAKTGAKLAVGTLFAGCSVLLDLGVRVTRKLPLEGPDEGLRLETADGEIAVTERAVGRLSGGAPPLGWWSPGEKPVEVGEEAIAQAVRTVHRNIFLVDAEGALGVGLGGRAVLGADTLGVGPSYPLRAYAPALSPRLLGDPEFRAAHGLQYAYVAGAMANGISSEELVEAASRAGMLGVFGAAGLSLQRIEEAIDRLQRNLGDGPYGFNLIHSPNEPDLEAAVVDLYLRRGVRLVSASAYLDLTLPLVKYRVAGIHHDEQGRVVCPNRVIAKVSRQEVARKFFSPPPPNLLRALVDSGQLTHEQAALAESVPMAEDVTAEADSAGHTDNRPAVALIPSMIALRDELQAKYQYDRPVRVGAAGGIATPASAAAVLAMGAAYIVTGSVNQACVEAGTSRTVREMLTQASQADIAMAPAADMFEMGVKVQVLKWGTMFAVRARKLYELYKACGSLEEIPAAQRALLERDYLRCPVEEAWAQTRRFFEQHDPQQVQRAQTDAKHRMALVFRSYLGRSSDWANSGEGSRKMDYQVWCGPAMGAFNEWVRGSFLERLERREVVTVAMNLLLGAAVLRRVGWIADQGVVLPQAARQFRPLESGEITALVDA